MAPTYVALHGSYNLLQLAFCKGNQCLSVIKQDDVRASTHLINYLDTLLHEHNTSITDLDFFVVDYGPGAFTSLRVTIAAVNGLGFAVGTKLVPVSGLDALIAEATAHAKSNTQITIALLNAYNNDVYFLISAPGHTFKNAILQEYGYGPIESFLESLAAEFGNNQDFAFVGNGAALHQELLKQHLPTSTLIIESLIPSIEYVAQLGLQQWLAGNPGTTRITPLYLKTQLFAIKK